MTRPIGTTEPSPRGPVLGPLCAFLGGVALLTFGIAARRQHWVDSTLALWLPALPVIVAGWGAAVTVFAGRRRHAYPAAVRFWAGCIIGAGAWSGWSLWWWGHGWLVAGPAIVAVLATASAMLEAPAFAPPAPIPSTVPTVETFAGKPKEWRDWEMLIDRICAIDARRGAAPAGVSVTGITAWPNKAGYTIAVTFPLGSPYSYRVLQERTLDLAAAKRLPKGCTILAEEGEHQGAALLKVTTVNDTATVTFPTDYSPRSVRDEFPIGMFPDRTQALIELYQASGIVAGMRGAGKTVLLQVITAMLVRCTDCVVIHVDLNGGGMAGPWLTPYATGRVGVPAVDWVACDAREALLIAKVLTEVAKDRKARYQRYLIQHNTDVLPVSVEIPEIVVIVDEGGEVFGATAPREAQQAAAAFRQLQAIGRAMCVNVLLSTQRAVSTYIPSDVRVATALKICGVVDTDAELAYLFDWARGLRCADLTGPGHGFIRRGQAPPRKFRWYHLLPAQIGEIAVATASLRPRMDPVAVAIGGDVYAQRWERARPWLDALAGVDPGQAAAPVPFVAPEPVMGAAEAADLTAQVLASLRGETAAAVSRPKPTRPAKPEEEELPEEWRATAAQLAALPTTEDPPQVAADASDTTGREFVLALIVKAGADGVRTGAIFDAASAAGLTVRRATVSRWCNELRQQGLIVKSAQYATWVAAGQAAAS